MTARRRERIPPTQRCLPRAVCKRSTLESRAGSSRSNFSNFRHIGANLSFGPTMRGKSKHSHDVLPTLLPTMFPASVPVAILLTEDRTRCTPDDPLGHQCCPVLLVVESLEILSRPADILLLEVSKGLGASFIRACVR